MSDQNKFNLYEIVTRVAGEELNSLTKVAAPDIRRALATLVASSTVTGHLPCHVNLLDKGLALKDVPEHALVWTEDQGYLTDTAMGAELPATASYTGVIRVSE